MYTIVVVFNSCHCLCCSIKYSSCVSFVALLLLQLLVWSVFTARCICIARTMPWQDVSVYPFVHLSHSSILSKRINMSLNFSPSGSHTILVFSHQTVWQFSDGDRPPPNGGVKCRGYEKITIFDQYLTLPWKRYNIKPLLLWMANRKPYLLKLLNSGISNDLE